MQPWLVAGSMCSQPCLLPYLRECFTIARPTAFIQSSFSCRATTPHSARTHMSVRATRGLWHCTSQPKLHMALQLAAARMRDRKPHWTQATTPATGCTGWLYHRRLPTINPQQPPYSTKQTCQPSWAFKHTTPYLVRVCYEEHAAVCCRHLKGVRLVDGILSTLDGQAFLHLV